ncbi:dihydropteroate synthase [Martelella radicis]|uniref:Dihydropteroate synthase n=1 Tax=Martelella radicis TaxID=1397476 RepID=A0A7W6PAP1_9HYPH|nr:dihydropteroate synthase [Martelella radicis]MBB4121824.1 dihydropteroate synthase [Martelella radicis]
MMRAPKTCFRPRMLSCAGGRTLALGPAGVLMAIINVTPDSFSDGGRFANTAAVIDYALQAVADGAAILDIGGESTRPGAAPVSADEEQARVLPVIEALATKTEALISIDTYRADTARLAIAAGAHIINDVTGGTGEPAILALAARTGAGYCLMHTSRDRETLAEPVADQLFFLEKALAAARAAGVGEAQLAIDPGFGFGKDVEDNLDVMAHLDALHALDLPILIGTSRKRFVGAIGGGEDNLTRDFATASTTAITRLSGGAIFRVHNVGASRAALAFADAMIARRMGDLS